jgi:TatD DNase family protein
MTSSERWKFEPMKPVNIHCHELPPPEVIGIVSTEPGNDLPDTPLLSMGLHPWRLDNWRVRLKKIEEFAAAGKLQAIGECGLDRIRSSAPFDEQITVFEEQAKLAAKYQLPVIVHCVRAVPETIAVKLKHPGVPGWILHGYNSKPQLLQDALRHGFYVSFGPNVKPELIELTPLYQLFLETDDSTSDINILYQNTAKLLNQSVNILVRKIHENYVRIFT